MIERFISEYSERGFQFAYRLCGDCEEAKEMVQEAFFRVIKKWNRYDYSQPLENWFLTILRNVYFDTLRRSERRRWVSLDTRLGCDEPEGQTLADALPDGEEELLERLEREEEEAHVRAALDCLTVRQRAVLTLSDIQGLGYDQIAAVLDCPVGTVRSRLSRARAALKRNLLRRAKEVAEP